MCRCTLIDPRPQKVSKSQRKWLKSFAASQQHDVAAAQHPETNSLGATTETAATHSDLPSHASFLQQATTQLQDSTVASPASTIEALPAVTPVTKLSCSAPHAMAQANVFAAEACSLPDKFPAHASATEAELPATTVQAPASASEAIGVTDTAQAQASAAEAEALHQGQQGGTEHSQQPASQDQACLLQQSDSKAAAQQRWPDLQGTLSHQLQVGHKLLLVSIHLKSKCPELSEKLACQSIVVTRAGSMTQHLLQCK